MIKLYNNKILSTEILEDFDFEESKNNVKRYFMYLEHLTWELTKLNTHKGLIANYDFTIEYKKQPYMPIGKDVFNLSAKEIKEDELKKYISSYYWAMSILSDKEQIYIEECFINGKYEEEIVDLLGFGSIDSKEFKRLKRSAVYKFSDILDLVVNKVQGVKL